MELFESIRRLVKQLRADPHSKKILKSLSGAVFIVAIVSVSFEYLVSVHWTLGALLTAAAGALAMWTVNLAATSSRNSISMAAVFLSMAVLLGAVVCGGSSYILHTEGWAGYKVLQQATLDIFRNFYL